MLDIITGMYVVDKKKKIRKCLEAYVETHPEMSEQTILHLEAVMDEALNIL